MTVDSIWDLINTAESDRELAQHPKLTMIISPQVGMALTAVMLVALDQSPGHYGCRDHSAPQAVQHWFLYFADQRGYKPLGSCSS
jgi:hypothetical protein